MTLSTANFIAELKVAPDQLLDFFVVFARFEYALKAANFRKDPPAAADVSWDKFKVWLSSLGEAELAPVRAAGRYLIAHPPKKLVVHNDVPSWEDVVRSGQCDIRFLVEGVARVRNNLFHGSKWVSRPENPRRNSELLSATIAVIGSLLDVPSCSDIRRHFSEFLS